MIVSHRKYERSSINKLKARFRSCPAALPSLGTVDEMRECMYLVETPREYTLTFSRITFADM